MKKIDFAEPCLRPAFIPSGRSRGVKALGLRYERAAAKALPQATHGQWFRYLWTDSAEPHWCQTDLLWSSANRSIVFEVKLSYTTEGMDKLERLYLPVVSQATGRPTFGIQICRYLRAGIKEKVFQNLEDALAYAPAGLCVLHWNGKGQL